MNKQEAIEKLQGMKQLVEEGDKGSYEKGFINALTYALNVTKQLDEPEKPILPQCIADWLEVCKENLGFGLSSAMSHSTSAMEKQPNKVKGWFNFKDNQEKFAKAWLYGYEVEKEKLYTVELPNKPENCHIVLRKSCVGKVFFDMFYDDNWKEIFKGVKLTESEIKKDFEWAWQFAEEVEE